MDIDDLTVKQVKEISSLIQFNNTEPKRAVDSTLFTDVIGKYVIVRSHNEGINAGFVEAADSTGVILTDCRRIWYHQPKSKAECWYEGVANTGLASSSKVSAEVAKKIIIEDYSITICSQESISSIRGFKAHAQS